MIQLMAQAYDLGARAPAGQVRQGICQIPYIVDPCAVAPEVPSAGGDVQTLTAAVLHDTAEHTNVTFDDMRQDDGDRVARLVAAPTDAAARNDLPLAERKLAQTAHSGSAAPATRLIKLADQLCSLRNIAAASPALDATCAASHINGARSVANACGGVSLELDQDFAQAAHAAPATLATTWPTS